MIQHLIVAILLGLDSLTLCIGLGAIGGSWSTWSLTALLFGAADAAGTVFGMILAQHGSGRWDFMPFVAPVAIAAYGLFVLLSTVDVRRWAGSPFGLLALAVVMSLDNVTTAAFGDDAVATSASIVSSFVATSALALTGCVLGAALARRWPSLKRVLPGGAALAAALVMGLG